jgi:hypothetical protein
MFAHLEKQFECLIAESRGAYLGFQFVGLIPHFLNLLVILLSLDDHLIVFMLQAFNSPLVGKFLILGMFMCSFQLVLRICKLVIDTLHGKLNYWKKKLTSSLLAVVTKVHSFR